MNHDDPLWYKDAVIYQLHVKAYMDSTGDGIGDFRGLTSKLDYIRDLGVTAVWLLPFYPSPFRDDGYDISDYRNVHPSYGTMRDFRIFVREAHNRGLRVIIELIINHTSTNIRGSRGRARPSPDPNFATTTCGATATRSTRAPVLFFTDTESSNWAWDPEAKAYYWHRFFSHQPDLNFDNPRVVEAMIDVMRFWLDTGVDGLRLDAVPYPPASARVPTTKTLPKPTHYQAVAGGHGRKPPQSHAVGRSQPMARRRVALLRRWRRVSDGVPFSAHASAIHGGGPGGSGADHRHRAPDPGYSRPIDQWGIFLRNHDELTLEMVTDRERDYMYQFYAADPRAKINVGIRRRLAPLLNNDRRKIELLNSVLMSMPGTPIVYYGDEIGMGDNIYLGDRNGVRTPMQWSPDRNGGFSRTNPAQLYLPPIMDWVYGYDSVNVERQDDDPSSLLNWVKRLLAVRRSRIALGRGALSFLYPGNRKILAYLVRYEDEVVLCVANLSRSAEPVELDLSQVQGLRARGVAEPQRFSADRRAHLLAHASNPYAFYWFVLTTGSRKRLRGTRTLLQCSRNW